MPGTYFRVFVLMGARTITLVLNLPSRTGIERGFSSPRPLFIGAVFLMLVLQTMFRGGVLLE